MILFLFSLILIAPTVVMAIPLPAPILTFC